VRKKILIVEHEVTVAETLDRRLAARGYASSVASEAAQALAAFDDLRPDLVVLSLTLPRDAGREVCRSIRQRPLGALVPILFLGTGREEVRTVAEAIAAGADHYFRKPDALNDLLSRVVTYIGPGDESAAVPEPPPVTVTPADEDALVAALAPTSTLVGPPPAPESGLFHAIREVLNTAPPNAPRSRTWAEVSASPPPVAPEAGDALADEGPVEASAPPMADFTALEAILERVTTAPPEPAQAAPPGPAALPPEAEPLQAWTPGRRWTDEPLEAPQRSAPAAPPPAAPPPAAPARPAPPPPEPAAPPRAPAPAEVYSPPVAPPAASSAPLPYAPPLHADTPSFAGAQVFAPPRRPPHDPMDALTALLDAGRAIELERRGVAELLAALSNSGLSGRVEVASGGVLRRIFFDQGAPVFADSSEASEDLVGFLAAEGRITRATAMEARDRALVTGASPDEVLIDAGYLEPDDVHRALRNWVIERVTSLFGLEAGEATVLRGGPRPIDPVDLGMHPGRLVLDGVRRKYGRLRLFRAFGTPNTVPRPASGSQAEPPGLTLRQDEAAVLRLVDGRRTALEIARTAQLNEVDTIAVLHALGVLGLLDGPSGLRAQGLPPLDAHALERAGAPRTDDQHPGFRELVAQKHAEIHACDYFQVLGVPRAATGAEIRAAWERLRRLFDPHRVRRDGPLWAQVRDIVTVVDDAWAVLGNDRLRAHYASQLE